MTDERLAELRQWAIAPVDAGVRWDSATACELLDEIERLRIELSKADVDDTVNEQAVAGLERENSVLRAALETVCNWIDQRTKDTLAAYPIAVFPEPPSGQHGNSVDVCSARAIRHCMIDLRDDLIRLFQRVAHLRKSDEKEKG